MKCVLEDGTVIAEDVEIAEQFFKRLKGLMFRQQMAPNTAMLLSPWPQIHTCFMRFALDVLFIDKEGVVQYVMENLKPWRLSPIIYRAAKTLEMPADTLKGRVKVGDKIYFK